jgi:hypothetical protein
MNDGWVKSGSTRASDEKESNEAAGVYMLEGPCAGVDNGVVLSGCACLHILAPQTNSGRYERQANHPLS